MPHGARARAGVAGGFDDGSISLWEPRTGCQLALLRGHTGGIWSLALSANGSVMASGSADGTVRLWNPNPAQLLTVLEGHEGLVWSVALSADGQLVASGGGDGLAQRRPVGGADSISP